MSTSTKLQTVFAKALAVPEETITDDLEYQGIPEWDSVSHMMLVTEIEAAWNLTIATEDVLAMGSVAMVKELLEKYGVDQNT